MTSHSIAALTALFLCTMSLAACTALQDTGLDTAGETADTGDCWAGLTAAITAASFDYSSGESWYFSVDLEGWASDVYLDISYLNHWFLWEESHLLDNTSFDSCGAEDHWELELPVVTSVEDQLQDQSTLIAADEQSASNTTFMFTAWDYWDNSLTDCLVMGANPAAFGEFGCDQQ